MLHWEQSNPSYVMAESPTVLYCGAFDPLTQRVEIILYTPRRYGRLSSMGLFGKTCATIAAEGDRNLTGNNFLSPFQVSRASSLEEEGT